MQQATIPLVSVIIPCFNHGEYIDDTVQSILDQSYENIEIVIVDDGSTDQFTIDFLSGYKQQNTKIIWQENKKTSAARNKGFSHTIGEYILTIDADDLIDHSFVEKSVRILETYPRIGAVSAWAICFGEETYTWQPSGGSIENFISDINCPSMALIRRNVWLQNGGFDEKLQIGYEDWDFWLCTTSNGWYIHILHEYLYYYRQLNNSRAKKAVANRESIVDIFKRKYSLQFDKFNRNFILENSENV